MPYLKATSLHVYSYTVHSTALCEQRYSFASPCRATVFSWTDERSPGHLLRVDPFSGRHSVPRSSDVLWGDRVHSTEEEPHTYDLTGTAIVRGTTFFLLLFLFVCVNPKIFWVPTSSTYLLKCFFL